jgi:hypothetical protein
VIVIVFNLGGGVGLVAGGAAGQLLYNRKKELMPVLCAAANVAVTAPMYYLVRSLWACPRVWLAGRSFCLVAGAQPCRAAYQHGASPPRPLCTWLKAFHRQLARFCCVLGP